MQRFLKRDARNFEIWPGGLDKGSPMGLISGYAMEKPK